MHLPDGYLDLRVALACLLLAAVALWHAGRRARPALEDDRVALLGVVSAGIFAAQLLNWPIPGGTSAHLLGGALAAVLLGPHLAVIAVGNVVVVQTFVFGDGGLTALGANLLNVAVVGPYVGWAAYRALGERPVAGAFLAGWLAATAGAVAAAIELGLSSTFAYRLETTLVVMGGGHLLLGLVEGAITAAVVRSLARARPGILDSGADAGVDPALSPPEEVRA